MSLVISGGTATITGALPAGGNTIGSVVGNVADGVADSGNPLKVGGRYLVTAPTYTDGMRGDLQIGARGSLAVSLFSQGSASAILGVTDNADGTAVIATSGRLSCLSELKTFNGTTFDRTRSSATTPGLLQAQIVGAASAGATMARVMSAATTNATSVKASAATLYAIQATNTGAAAVFLKLYNKASAPTVGTDVPVWTVAIPAGASASFASATGYAFATGLAYAITNLVADADTTAVLLNQVTGVLAYV